ncbi:MULTISPECIES: gas vesicle protein GvpG [unclassified Streptomyces]|uniref:gas vesicle protein GvpG n=1 Tax=unclassified Streptomyces TaxID=2593676 RepID=UPI0035DF7A54
MAEERRPRGGKTSTAATWRKRRPPKRGGAIHKHAPQTHRAASCGPAALLQHRRRCRHSRAGRRSLTETAHAPPNTPFRGVIWVAEKLNDAAERELHDPGVLRAHLVVLNREFEDGVMSLEEFEPGRGKAARPAACCTGRPRTERSKVTHPWITQPR